MDRFDSERMNGLRLDGKAEGKWGRKVGVGKVDGRKVEVGKIGGKRVDVGKAAVGKVDGRKVEVGKIGGRKVDGGKVFVGKADVKKIGGRMVEAGKVFVGKAGRKKVDGRKTDGRKTDGGKSSGKELGNAIREKAEIKVERLEEGNLNRKKNDWKMRGKQTEAVGKNTKWWAQDREHSKKNSGNRNIGDDRVRGDERKSSWNGGGSRKKSNGCSSVRENQREIKQSSDRRMTFRQEPRELLPDKNNPCPIMKQCGGCQLLNLEYSEQLKRKQNHVKELFKDICPVHPIVGMEDPFHYRNKVHAVFDRDSRGNIISGIYQENSHDVVPVEECMIEDEKADEIIGSIRGMLKSFKIRTYDEDTGFGLLRHVLIRRAFATNEIMVVLVTASPVFPSKNNFVKALREKHPEITTIVQNVNGRGTSMVLGKKENILYGNGHIVDELCGCKFRISPRSFYQVNPVQTEALYGKALELAGLTGKELVVDAYCGIGTIGMIASKLAGQVIGVELNQDAVRDAACNAKMNGIKNIRFYCNDAGRFLVNMAERGEKADIVIMDPPRSGSTGEFLDSIAKMGAAKVVYVSCNPETLARDVRYMMKLGYRAGGVWGVDMFPGTKHVESVVLMSRVQK